MSYIGVPSMRSAPATRRTVPSPSRFSMPSSFTQLSPSAFGRNGERVANTPSLVFPTLINLAQKHLAKLNEGQRITLDKSIGELSDKLGETFPKQLMLAEQGAFQLGYYQQRQEFFKKKTDTTEQKEEA